MFKVSFDIKVVIKGCPSNGLNCLDFRRKHGLPDDATNEVYLKCEFVDEQVCRTYPDYIDHNCDLPVKRNGWSGSTTFGKYNAEISVVMEPLEIAPEIVSRFLVTPDQNPIPMLDSILSEVCRHITQREKAVRERELREKEEKVKRAEEYAKHEQEKAQKVQERIKWIQLHGSELLKERLANGFEWEPLYEQQFAEKVFSEMGLGEEASNYQDWHVDILDRTTPTLEEIRFLKEVRGKTMNQPAQAELVWVKYQHPDTGEKAGQCELAVTVTCPTGREITRYFEVK